MLPRQQYRVVATENAVLSFKNVKNFQIRAFTTKLLEGQMSFVFSDRIKTSGLLPFRMQFNIE